MAKRELIDESEVMMLVGDIFECQCDEKEAYELLNNVSTFTEQEIVKPYLENIKKLLKETYLEVANMDLDTKTIGDTQSLSCSKFRNSMISKIDNLLSENEGE